MSYNISQYVSDEIVKYLNDSDVRNEEIKKLKEKVLLLERYAHADGIINCTYCDEYKPRFVRCSNWHKGCRFAWCEQCELTKFGTVIIPFIFDSYMSGYTCICTKLCFETLGDGSDNPYN